MYYNAQKQHLFPWEWQVQRPCLLHTVIDRWTGATPSSLWFTNMHKDIHSAKTLIFDNNLTISNTESQTCSIRLQLQSPLFLSVKSDFLFSSSFSFEKRKKSSPKRSNTHLWILPSHLRLIRRGQHFELRETPEVTDVVYKHGIAFITFSENYPVSQSVSEWQNLLQREKEREKECERERKGLLGNTCTMRCCLGLWFKGCDFALA